MHDPVANCGELEGLGFAQPGADCVDCRGNVGYFVRPAASLDQRRAVIRPRDQPRPTPDPVDLSPDQALQRARLFDAEYLELDAR